MKPWLLEVMTEDGLAFHCSRHHTLEEAEIRRDQILADWRRQGWGQDPALDHVSAKSIHSCVTRTGPTPEVQS